RVVYRSMRTRLTTRMKLAALAAVAALGLAACGDATAVSAGDGTTVGTEADPATSAGDAGELLLRVDVGGGFVPIEVHLSHLPILSVYDSGLVLVPAPVPAIYPGPALGRLNASLLSEEGLA